MLVAGSLCFGLSIGISFGVDTKEDASVLQIFVVVRIVALEEWFGASMLQMPSDDQSGATQMWIIRNDVTDLDDAFWLLLDLSPTLEPGVACFFLSGFPII